MIVWDSRFFVYKIPHPLNLWITNPALLYSCNTQIKVVANCFAFCFAEYSIVIKLTPQLAVIGKANPLTNIKSADRVTFLSCQRTPIVSLLVHIYLLWWFLNSFSSQSCDVGSKYFKSIFISLMVIVHLAIQFACTNPLKLCLDGFPNIPWSWLCSYGSFKPS